ncbi:uncharacterized protein LOC100371904 isoform X2 [Saccoglossus kowalevskii]|uniref:Uncharacterized protein LOC100371904 isoform X1 n=1 Tax=Saccoglossus kowalevskii TaxID=10224 RepID=A0ABM0GJW4_SACKO|nr:PREDICTED: uncharacterized protein LOC100371904 isoform X1 [Saccoglossus kowalevskii]
MLRVAQSGSLQRWQQVTPVLLSASPLSTPTGKAQLSSHHSHDTLHVLQKNDKKVSPVPPSIQGVQPMSAKPTKDVLSQAQSFLKNQEDRSKVLRDKIQNANQGAACREFHTSVSHGASCGTVVEEWDDEMACVLQGTCLPGSTMYCRTKSMFGKLKLSDVDQGTFGTVQGVRRYSTSSPAFSPVRRLSDSFGRTYEAWDEDLVTQVPVPNKPSFNNIPKIDKATRSYYQAEPRAQFVPVTRFGDAKRSYHTGDIVPLSQRMGRSFETWDEDVAHMIHNLHSKPVFGRPRRDIRPPSDPPKVYVPWY